MRGTTLRTTLAGLAACLLAFGPAWASDPLPSWNDGPARTAIAQFVESISDPASRDYVPPAGRIAVFDNDGTLWSEQPVYFQLLYVVSGSGVEFLRAWTESVYGIPPEQVIGSTIATRYELRDGEPAIVRLPQVDFVDDKAGKPVGIHKFIGRGPIAAFDNSDGDFQMLEWVTSQPQPTLAMLVHHDDAQREFAYDRDSHVGRLERGLDEAAQRGWSGVSVARDWNRVYPVRN